MKNRLMELAIKIREFCGIDLTGNLPNFEMKLARRLRETGLGLPAYQEYISRCDPEWEKLIELVTINETYFFREFSQLMAFQQLLKQNPADMIRVWCVPCSTGEEAYSLAIMAKEIEPSSHSRIKIHACDLNKNVLEQAKRGIYTSGSLSFRRMPQDRDYISRYFIQTPEGYEVRSDIKEMVTFETFNLTDYHSYAKYAPMDIIFCRNVLFYFNDEINQRIIHSFYEALKEGGHLFLGHAESISSMSSPFIPVRANETFYYQKQGNLQQGQNHLMKNITS